MKDLAAAAPTMALSPLFARSRRLLDLLTVMNNAKNTHHAVRAIALVMQLRIIIKSLQYQQTHDTTVERTALG